MKKPKCDHYLGPGIFKALGIDEDDNLTLSESIQSHDKSDIEKYGRETEGRPHETYRGFTVDKVVESLMCQVCGRISIGRMSKGPKLLELTNGRSTR